MKEYGILIGVLVLVAIGGLWAASEREVQAPDRLTCTQEAKICPDGSAVGRTGPDCSFAECPGTSGSIILEARIGQEVSGLDVRLMPLAVLADNRCPGNVQCIQAGTVSVRVRITSGLGTATPTFTLDNPVTTEAETITLVSVLPSPMAGVRIQESGYTFQFKIEKR